MIILFLFSPWNQKNGKDGTAGVDNLYGAAVVGNESALVLTGRTAGDWENTNAGDFDFMAAKFTADGAEQWRFQVGLTCS